MKITEVDSRGAEGKSNDQRQGIKGVLSATKRILYLINRQVFKVY